MGGHTRYTFEWDPIKAGQNLRKHGISFDRAAEVFLDPLAISIFDEEHSEREERWVTLGKDKRGIVLVLIHTFLEVSAEGGLAQAAELAAVQQSSSSLLKA